MATGRELARRRSLLDAAIAEIGARRSTSVTVGQIAERAGVSSALAHHYFGTKQNLLVAAMRRILGIYADEVRAELGRATDPEARVAAIVRASFAASNFRPDVVRTWLALYLTAQTEPEAARLFAVYRRRLRSNLAHALAPDFGDRRHEIAETVAAMIDGLYIRSALADAPPVPDPEALVLACLDGLRRGHAR